MGIYQRFTKTMKKLIIFDVCNTIVDTNSTFSYLDFLISMWIKPEYKILFHNKFLWYFYTSVNLIFHYDIKIFLTKRYFRWLNVKKIKLISREYFKRYESKIFPNILTIINHEKKSSKIILLSSSINPPIDFLKNKLCIEWFSSILEEKDWKYTWEVLQPLRWKKEIIFENKMFELKKYDQIDLYTDNHDDVNLIKYFSKQTDNLKIYIMSHWDKKYWNNFFIFNKISYEFMD